MCRLIRLLGLTGFCALSACVLNSPPEPGELPAQALPGVQVPPQWSADGNVGEPVAHNWLAAFADNQLDVLVAEAMAHNADLLVAVARVAVASEYVELAESKLYPQVNALARGGGQMGGDSSGLQGYGLFADWELDLWGRVRAAKAANVAGYESTVADAEYARQSIAALVAKGYFVAVEAELQQSLAEEMVAASEHLIELNEQRLKVGKGDGFELARTRANTESFRDTALQLTLAHTQALRALETLIGRYPAATVDIAPDLAPWPGPIPAGLPSELLERRPDVVAAERRVAAAFYRTEEAKAARLPKISLTGSINDISSELFVLEDRDNPVWSAGASLLAPIFTGGGLKAQVRIRSAEQRQAVAEYGEVGARAFSEVENALAAEIMAGRREEVLARGVAENEQALDLARVRYRVGSGDLLGIQQQQLAVHGSRATLLRVRTERLVQRVNLYLALGGGFDETTSHVASAKE